MPFVQRVVQPVNLAQVATNNGGTSASGKRAAIQFQCIPGKCKNVNCINKEKPTTTATTTTKNESELESARASNSTNGATHHASTRTTANVKDTGQATTTTTTITKAIIHTANDVHQQAEDFIDASIRFHRQQDVSGFGSNSFSYATDTEDDATRPFPTNETILPMKKLKQHVEFLSSPPTSPVRNFPRNTTNGIGETSLASRSSQRRFGSPARPAQTPTAAKIVPGYEFDSISNVTLSNALRQLASLVLIASDIFDNLHQELECVGERARVVQRKIVNVERRVSAYDPKMVTVPESDLLTFAQRKTHYNSDKTIRKELFTTETRPPSVRVLYEDAGKVTPPPSATVTHATSPTEGIAFTSDGIVNGDGSRMVDSSHTGATTAAGSDELVCTPVFGRANRKMRTRIDAEIEIRLPAGIEDLRKWTSTEALGDVTVTPDCMHHVDTSISTSMVIGDNGVLTPAMSPSVLSADAVDALYSINNMSAIDNSQIPKDVPLNHRLPSPEEQLQIIALKYPAEVISVDISGKRFQRMCAARKSTTGCFTNMSETNNLNDDVQTVSRRSRSRKVRGKRRNTIAGIDQKEIQDAANGEIKNSLAAQSNNNNKRSTTGAEQADAIDEDIRRVEKSKKFGRSKSSDLLKKDSVALPYDKGKNTLTRLNSLKQWGRNRFKFMQRNDISTAAAGLAATTEILVTANNGNQDTCNNMQNATPDKVKDVSTNTITNSHNNSGSGICATKSSTSKLGGNIDDECVVHELISQKGESRFSHERKPSYSSSEKSMSVSSSGHLKGKLHLATCGNVKLRDTSSLNRQRRSGITANGLGGKEEQPHSSSGNWSASSESGRASIGSEITIQPKSSASNTSLNVSSFHPGSGPPSSMMSRRRFLNTSASSSVTSEGTATPELQMADGGYPNHLDDETSSAYSCDTEGYYTSFHMDSGLRTLKEEEPPMTPLQIAQNIHTSNYSFGSQSNHTTLTAENEYELFGRGSTSTTTSSAGTVCTTLMANGEQISLHSLGPDVPERNSSLGKLNKSGQSNSNSASSSTLERSYSSSTIGSTLERTGTIKRNVNAGLKLAPTEAEDIDARPTGAKRDSITETPESQEDEFDFEQRLRKRGAQPLPHTATIAELECSESSDLEGVERIERIKQKTAINAKRIPSMCIITPTTSDDENQSKENAYDPNRTLTNEIVKEQAKKEKEPTVQLKINETTGYATVEGDVYAKIAEAPLTPTKKTFANTESESESNKDHNLNLVKRNPHAGNGFNSMLEKLKVVLPNIKRSPHKSTAQRAPAILLDDEDLYDAAGEYVTIADISNNNRHNRLPAAPKASGASRIGIYYSNDIVRRKLNAVGANGAVDVADGKAVTDEGNEPTTISRRETEYVSLNELPYHLRKSGSGSSANSAKVAESNRDDNDEDREQQRIIALECADSVPPMYAEISELREDDDSTTSPSVLLQQKGAARVRVNAQGKFIYDSDSLKRRKGAHTTFAPGPYVKETESALPENTNENNLLVKEISNGSSESASSAIPTTRSNNIVASKLVPKSTNSTTTGAKLLLLNGGVAATRKIANVRPIVAKSPLTLAQRQQQQQQHQTLNNNNLKIAESATAAASAAAFIDKQQRNSGIMAATTTPAAFNYHQDNKNILANNTNPFFQPTVIAATANTATAAPGVATIAMMPSPSTKSTSSTGSTISSSASTLTSGSSTSSASSKEEGYQRFIRTGNQQQSLRYQQPPTMPVAATVATLATSQETATPFQRNLPIYWTLQNRRQVKPQQQSSATCRDDLYATPIRRSERAAAAAARAAATTNVGELSSTSLSISESSGISPIVPRNRNAFGTSTPTKLDSQLPADNIPAKQPVTRWDDNSPERFKTCADRIGQSKTSLMDFKKLLLAKSTKASPVQRKVSAVELLKKTNVGTTSTGIGMGQTAGIVTPAATSTQALNSSMKLLNLSGSPKTFANRRMLRQGQFGSPSKSFVPKLKANSPNTWRNNAVQHTDIMSTIIPEANSEEDHSNTSGGSNSSKAGSEPRDGDTVELENQSIPHTTSTSPIKARSFDLKRNFFLQTEENNFMRGELKPTFGRTTTGIPTSTAISNTSKYAGATLGVSMPSKYQTPIEIATLLPSQEVAPTTNTATPLPALETAL